MIERDRAGGKGIEGWEGKKEILWYEASFI